MLIRSYFKLLYKPINNVACLQQFKRKSNSSINTTVACYTTAGNDNALPASAGIPGAQLLFKYNPEQIEQILNTINSSNLDQLLRYEISKARAYKLQSWIKKNGPIKRSQDLLVIDGLSANILQKFCNSVLAEKLNEHGNLTANSLRLRSAPFVYPTISEIQRQQIRSCTSIRIGVSSVCWARLEMCDDNQTTPFVLTDWKHHEISEKKLHLNDLIERCLYIDHLLPTADCYLFENPQMAQININSQNASQQNIDIQKAQVTAVLSFALSARRRILEGMEKSTEFPAEDDAQIYDKQNKSKITKNREILPNVFFLRRFLTARLFKHLVGTERVSSEQTVINLMRTFYNVEDVILEGEDQSTEGGSLADTKEQFSLRGKVEFPQELRQMFSQAERFQREFLGQALLLNLAFLRLELLQDADSIALVTRNPNRSLGRP